MRKIRTGDRYLYLCDLALIKCDFTEDSVYQENKKESVVRYHIKSLKMFASKGKTLLKTKSFLNTPSKGKVIQIASKWALIARNVKKVSAINII